MEDVAVPDEAAKPSFTDSPLASLQCDGRSSIPRLTVTQLLHADLAENNQLTLTGGIQPLRVETEGMMEGMLIENKQVVSFRLRDFVCPTNCIQCFVLPGITVAGNQVLNEKTLLHVRVVATLTRDPSTQAHALNALFVEFLTKDADIEIFALNVAANARERRILDQGNDADA